MNNIIACPLIIEVVKEDDLIIKLTLDKYSFSQLYENVSFRKCGEISINNKIIGNVIEESEDEFGNPILDVKCKSQEVYNDITTNDYKYSVVE